MAKVFCSRCGSELDATMKFCPRCGAKIDKPKTLPAEGPAIPGSETIPTALEWDYNINFFNRFIAIDLLKALGISILVIGIILLLTVDFSSPMSVEDQGWVYALGLVGIIAVLVVLVIYAVYRNRYEVRFRVDNQGVSYKTRKSTRKKNAAINWLLFTLGFLSHKPGYMGIALIGEAGQSSSMGWRDVREVKVYPKNRVVMLKSSLRKMLIYCTPENYETVAKMCEFFQSQTRAKAGPSSKTSRRKA